MNSTRGAIEPLGAAFGYAPFALQPRQAVTRDFERDRDAAGRT